MGSISKGKTWVDNENVTYTDLNSNFDTVYNEVNGNLDNDNVDASANIAESKIAFNTSTGHTHDGVDSAAIPRGYGWYVSGGLVVSTDASGWIYITQDQTVSKVIAIVKTAPTGASLIVDVEKSTDNGATWTSLWNTTTANRPTITSGSREATQDSLDTTKISEGDYLRVAIDQVGSTEAGRNLTVQIVT